MQENHSSETKLPAGETLPEKERDGKTPRHPGSLRPNDRTDNPPDSIPNPMPGLDPQQTPGIDHPPAEADD